MFSGAMMRMGKELGIDTPYNEYTYHIIKALEEKNDGMFDYDKNSEAVTYSKQWQTDLAGMWGTRQKI